MSTPGGMDVSRGSGSLTTPSSNAAKTSAYAGSTMDMSVGKVFAGLSGDEEVTGMLLKRRGGFGKHMPNAWQLRFFMLKDGILFYFEENDSKTPRGRLELKSCEMLLGVPIDNAPTPYTMQISPIGGVEKWKLCAESADELEKWCSVIKKYVKSREICSDDESFSGEVDKSRRSPKNTSGSADLPAAAPAAPPNRTTNAMAVSTSITTPSTTVNVRPFTATTSTTVAKPTDVAHATSKSVPGRKKKGGLRLKVEPSAAPEEVEMASALVIVNVCIVMIRVSDSTMMVIVYVLILNFVVYRTLTLRAKRIAEASAAAAHAAAHASAQHAALATPVAEAQVVEEEAQLVPERSGPPEPGSTLEQVFTVPPNVPDHTWWRCDHRTFSVREGPDYNRFKKKAPSAAPLYEAFAVDVFCTKTRLDHAATHIKLPDTSSINTNHKSVPPLLIVQIQIPSDPPPVFGTVENGPGWAILMYFKITEETCNQLKNLSTASPAVKLFAQYCEKAPTDPNWRARFKVITFCSNLEEMGVPNIALQFNAKPVLIRRTGSIFVGSNYLEIDIHVHKFANMAKKSIHALSSRCGQMYMQIGFVVEGREDQELPETLFACVGVNRPQEERAEFLFDTPDED